MNVCTAENHWGRNERAPTAGATRRLRRPARTCYIAFASVAYKCQALVGIRVSHVVYINTVCGATSSFLASHDDFTGLCATTFPSSLLYIYLYTHVSVELCLRLILPLSERVFCAFAYDLALQCTRASRVHPESKLALKMFRPILCKNTFYTSILSN